VRALLAHPRVDLLEERNLLTSGLVVVPSPVIDGSELFSAAVIASNDRWAVGFVAVNGARQTFAEHFNGTSWSVVPTPSLKGPSGAELDSVSGVASNDVWAVGIKNESGKDFGTSLIEHWNGTSWSEVASPVLKNGGYLSGVAAVSSNDVWAVGAEFGSTPGLVEHWNGTSWSTVSSPAFANVGFFSPPEQPISADASNDVWAVGVDQTTAGPAALHWNGQTWSVVPVAVTRFGFSSVTALSPTDVWGAGGAATGEPLDTNVPAIVHWDGTSWKGVATPNPNPGSRNSSGITGIAAISANDIWAVGPIGSNAQPLTEHWDGTSWSIVASPNAKATSSLIGVTARGDGTVVAVGFQVSSKASTGLIMQNAASAPKTAPLAAARTAPVRTAGRTAAAPTVPAPLDGAAVDQLFAVDAQAGQAGSLAGHGTRRPRRRQTPIGTAHRGHGVGGSGLITRSGPEPSSGPERDATGFTHHSNLLHRGHKPWLGCLAGF
jgi:hypothetical protein